MNPTPEPNVHPRDAVIERAVQEFLDWLSPWRGRHGLTPLESIHVLNTQAFRILRDELLAERDRLRTKELENAILVLLHDPKNLFPPETVQKLKKLIGAT